ncbi:hypothetical protein D3C76_779980 [compost metagenome]
MLGELDGVGQQVAEYLAQVLFGTVLVPGQLLVNVQLQAVAVVPGHGLEQRQYFLAQLAQGKTDQLGAALALLEPGEIQHFVENRQQPLAGLVQGLDTLAVGRLQPASAQQLGHAENAVERCAQLMAHGRQEA